MRKRRGRAARTTVALLAGLLLARREARELGSAQLRAVAVLALVMKLPGLGPIVRALTPKPRVLELQVNGEPTSLYVPGRGSGPWPTVLFINGATADGRHQHSLVALGHALARAGFVYAIPEVPGLRDGVLTEEAVESLAAIIGELTQRDEVEGGMLSIVSVCVGGSIGMLASVAPQARGRVRAIVGIAPYARIRNLARLALTNSYEVDGEIHTYESAPRLGADVARTVVSKLENAEDRSLIGEFLPDPEQDPSEPIVFDLPIGQLRSPEARAVAHLLENRDPERFEELLNELPQVALDLLTALDPLTIADQLTMPVRLLTSPRDKFFPLTESQALADALPDARLVVSASLSHGDPDVSLSTLVDLVRFDAFAVEALAAMRRSPDVQTFVSMPSRVPKNLAGLTSSQ